MRRIQDTDVRVKLQKGGRHDSLGLKYQLINAQLHLGRSPDIRGGTLGRAVENELSALAALLYLTRSRLSSPCDPKLKCSSTLTGPRALWYAWRMSAEHLP